MRIAAIIVGVLGVLTLLLDLLFVWAPAARMGGQLALSPALTLTFGGLAMIVVSVALALTHANERTNGAVGGVLRMIGAGYFGYKVTIAAARHFRHEIRED